MFRPSSKYLLKNYCFLFRTHTRSFLTNEYKCEEAWDAQKSSSLLNTVNLNDFFTTLTQNYTSKGVISAIDVDVFANAIRDSTYLDELKELLHKLRMSAETGNMLDSTHHATIRNYIKFGNIQDLVNMLRDPLNYGIFLDNFTANILLDKLVTSKNYELAANVAALTMLQEEYSNEITCALSQYACYKYLTECSDNIIQEPVKEEDKKKEEIKIRVKFLRNPYYDDHFDIKEISILSGWLYYKKYDQMLSFCEVLHKIKSFKIYNEVIELMQKQSDKTEEAKHIFDRCISLLNECSKAEIPLEESVKNLIENAINKTQKNDILMQQKLFEIWINTRENKLKEQLQRLERARRMEAINLKQKELEGEEQKLWFFENEDNIDLQIEEKEKLVDTTAKKKSEQNKLDENYIPPEILPKRK
ncbi:unnamed protein product [Parnassius mnemosyne]|uniref:Mitochondrial 28S ribosomal protein S27 n=1 Tax=Parnassius mnemosyne TaxID=213953 RepID=A0AAV1K591_9NEOP